MQKCLPSAPWLFPATRILSACKNVTRSWVFMDHHQILLVTHPQMFIIPQTVQVLQLDILEGGTEKEKSDLLPSSTLHSGISGRTMCFLWGEAPPCFPEAYSLCWGNNAHIYIIVRDMVRDLLSQDLNLCCSNHSCYDSCLKAVIISGPEQWMKTPKTEEDWVKQRAQGFGGGDGSNTFTWGTSSDS